MNKADGDRLAREALTQELACLMGGRWANAWYWVDNLMAMQASGGHCCPELQRYRPTNRWAVNPGNPAVRGRVWVLDDTED